MKHGKNCLSKYTYDMQYQMIKDKSSRHMMINDKICPGGNDEIGKMEPSERHLLIPQVILMLIIVNMLMMRMMMLMTMMMMMMMMMMPISSGGKTRQPVKLSYSSKIAFVLLYELKTNIASLHHEHCDGDDIDSKGVYDEDDKDDNYIICCC